MAPAAKSELKMSSILAHEASTKNLPAKRVAEVKANLDVYDTNSVTNYAVPAQKAVNSVSDQILKGVRAKDVGPVAHSLTEIVSGIRGLDVSVLDKKPGLLAKLFRSASPMVSFLASLETTEHQIDAVVVTLDKHKTSLQRSVAQLDVLYNETVKSAVDLDIYITALREKMTEFEETILPELKAKVEAGSEAMAAQEYSDAKSVFDRLDRKHNNLCITRQVALQNLPSIRLTQEHDASLIEKINEIQVNTLPMWKRQIALAIESNKTAGAAKAANDITEISNQMLVAGAKQLGMAQIEAQKSIERSIIDVEAVKEANDIVINTIASTQQLIADGRQKRREAEEIISKAEDSLLTAIIAQ